MYQSVDHRGPVSLREKLAEQIWKPDLYFENARHVEMETKPVEHRLIKLYSSGRVWMATRYRLTLGCDMDFHRFPFDVHHCTIAVQDYSHTSQESALAWFNDTDPFTMAPLSMKDPKFVLTDSRLTTCQHTLTAGGHPCLRASLELSRDIGHSVRQFHMPTLLLLLAIYFSTLLGRNMPNIRFGYLFVILILMCTAVITVRISGTIPQVGYFTYYDYWLWVSFIFYFLTVLHCTVVMMVVHRKETPDYLCLNKARMLLAEESGECREGREHRHAPPMDRPNARLAWYLDLSIIVLYPALLISFLIAYWLWVM